MPWFIVKQPNGLYARFTTVVDDFTHLNLSREEALDVCLDDIGRRYAAEKVQRADEEVVCVVTFGTSLTRWEGCLKTIADVHGKEQAELRRAQGA